VPAGAKPRRAAPALRQVQEMPEIPRQLTARGLAAVFAFEGTQSVLAPFGIGLALFGVAAIGIYLASESLSSRAATTPAAP